MAIDGPGLGKTIGRRRIRVSGDRGLRRAYGNAGKITHSRKAGSRLRCIYICRVRQAGAEAKRAVLTESVDYAFAEVIKVDSKAGTDGCLAVGSVRDCETRRKVVLLRGPVPGW